MSFIWPWLLFSLLLLPICVLVYRRFQRQRQLDAVRLGALGILRGSGARPVGRRRHIPPGLFLGALAVLLLATARPQMVLALPHVEGIVMLAFDVSASMGADDLEPTRMAAAKEAAQAFVERRPDNIKIGVVAFSEGGLVVQRPTDDEAAIAAAIDRLVPQSGTSLGQGILATLNAITTAPDAGQGDNDATQAVPRGAFAPAVIVLLTDGENTAPPDPLAVAQTAIERGVRIFTVGLGSSAGTTVEIDGFSVFSQLNEGTLKEIALLAEGDYLRAENAEELRAVFDDLDPQFAVKREKMEVTSIFGGISILVLLIGAGLSLLWFGRIP